MVYLGLQGNSAQNDHVVVDKDGFVMMDDDHSRDRNVDLTGIHDYQRQFDHWLL